MASTIVMHPEDISSRARRIHFSSIVFDAHADTPQRFLFERYDLGRRDGEGCVDIPRMREGGIGAIFFALWVPVDIAGPAGTRRAFDLLDAVEDQVRLHANDLALAMSCEEIRKARKENKIAVLLGVEGGHAIDDDLRVLEEFSARGVCYMTLTHNAATGWADSSNQSARHNGLTEFGKQVVREMNRLGMMVDISHVSDKTFRDVIEVSRAPVIASHSCCRAICNVPRNMSDAMIQALAARGGVIHITFHNAFLSQEYADASKTQASENALREQEAEQKFGENEARKLIAGQRLSDELIRAGKLPQVPWEKVIEHIDHAVRLAGPDHVGLGSDFDGAFMPEGMEDAANFPKITEGLLRKAYGEPDIRKILGENTLRVLAECERVACELQSQKS
jgi:membrane dipeptidase